MNIPKKYLRDRLILVLLSVNVFMTALVCLNVLLKLDSGRSASYIVQYRGNLGISALKQGTSSELISFILFALLVLVASGLLSIKVYNIRREVSVVVLLFGVLLLGTALIASNALLTLR